jgi:hypothetical protein
VAFQRFSKSSSLLRTILQGGYLLDGSCRETIQPEYSKVDEVDNDLAEEGFVREV